MQYQTCWNWRQLLWLLPALLLLIAGCRSETRRGAGVDYQHLTDATGPWSIHVVSFDLAQRDLSLQATVGAGVNGSETVEAMAAAFPRALGRPVAAVNGDYFEFLTEPRYRGTLQGLCIVNGELVSGPAGFACWIDAKEVPHIDAVRGAFTAAWPDGATVPFGLNCSTSDYKSEVRAADVVVYTPAFGATTGTEGGREYLLEPVDVKTWLPLRANARVPARVREMRTAGNTSIPPNGMVLSVARRAEGRIPPLQAGAVVTLATQLTPDLTGAPSAISGDPLLLAAGKVVPGLDATARHPRTAVGFAGTRGCLVVVDGRQPALSVGMSHRELAELMLRLGCTDAVNLDGGGSSTFWYQDSVRNAPSSGHLRPVGNALILVRGTR